MKNERLNTEIADQTAAISGLVESKQRDEASVCLLRAQIDSQGFCLDLLISRQSSIKEKNKQNEEVHNYRLMHPHPNSQLDMCVSVSHRFWHRKRSWNKA